MSEAFVEARESEAYTEGESEGEAILGEAVWPGFSQGARSDVDRSTRQQQMMMARLAQQRRPPPPSPLPASRRPAITVPSQALPGVRSEVRSLDFETKAALDSVRSRLNEANRLAYRNAWAAEASAAASQVLDSFQNGLQPHDWARALIRGAPTVLLSPGKPRRPGLEGLVFDPRVAGGALLAGIWAFGHFRNQSQGVNTLKVNFQGPLTDPAGANNTALLTVVAFDKAGNVLPNVTFTYASQTAGYFGHNETSPGVLTLTGQKKGTTWFTVTADGKSDGTFVTVT